VQLVHRRALLGVHVPSAGVQERVRGQDVHNLAHVLMQVIDLRQPRVCGEWPRGRVGLWRTLVLQRLKALRRLHHSRGQQRMAPQERQRPSGMKEDVATAPA